MTDYQSFLASKLRTAPAYGFTVDTDTLNPALLDFQAAVVSWACQRGRAATFLDCGLGKTLIQLEWARLVHEHTGGDVLIICPLAVAEQTRAEAEKFSIPTPVTVVREATDVRPGINIVNYERFERLDLTRFAGVVLDESSILKAYMGTTKRALVAAFRHTLYRLCCTATPAPNDHTEIGNHAEFLGIMPANEMLSRWFINDTTRTGVYRLKRHAEQSFWDWVASWAVSARMPSDLGFDDDGFILPELRLHQHVVRVDRTEAAEDKLFRLPVLSATEMQREMRLTAPARAEAVAELVNGSDEMWIVWCNTNYEADELTARIPDAVEVRGSDRPDEKIEKLRAFTNGDARVIITKPSLAGFGLNWQHCSHVAFVGLSYSMEQFYQALRRSYRFGQTRPVEAHVICAETEGQIVETVRRKLDDHESLVTGMLRGRQTLTVGEDLQVAPMTERETTREGDFTMHLGDCVETIKHIDDGTVDLSVFSPPFAGLYIYSDALQDMGNSADDDEFFQHFNFLIPELHRVTRPGRLCAVHCKQLVNYQNRDGMAGLRDFRGEIIRAFTSHGWAYHSEIVIWTDPVHEMQRTKSHGLLYKQLRKDSTFSRQGLPEYLVIFRRWPEGDDERERIQPVEHTSDEFPLDIWQRYASPVWFDIPRTDVLNVRIARDDRDEKHICPLQLPVIERALDLWSNPGDLIFDPFAGIGSTGYVALRKGRRFEGIELKRRYYEIALQNLREAQNQPQLDMFELFEAAAS